jgi:uncharacterized membrane protein
MFAGGTIKEVPMNTFAIYLAALLIGVVAGLRTFTPLAAVSWAAFAGAFRLDSTWLGFLGSRITPWILTALAIIELVADQLPRTPSRKTLGQFAARIASGAVCGAAVATTKGSWEIGLAIGIIGAILGTLVGAGVRTSLAHAFRRDRPAAFVEDAVAVTGAAIIVAVLV